MDGMNCVYIFIGFLFGACLGSFINVAAMRTVAEKKWWGSERSVCDSCGRVLTFVDLIPVVSFLALRGRCRTCGAKIHPRHFLAETGAGILGALFVWRFGLAPALAFAFLSLPFLLFHTLTDFESGYIYDSWSLAMVVAGLVLRIWGGVPALIDGAIGAAIGGVFIIAIVLVSRGGMGVGDATMMAGIGAIFGWKMAILCLYSGFMCGGVVVIPLLIMKKVSRKDAIPLGPFLAAGCVVAMFCVRPVFARFGYVLPWPWF